MKDKTYHLVLVIEDGTNLQSSDLFVDCLDGAMKMFEQKIREAFPGIPDAVIQDALDEGWYQHGSTVIMYTEPYNIFGKE